MFSSDAIERIKDALRPSDVVGRRVKLRRQGRTWIGLCCYHQERTPSLVCDDPRGTWKCFGCGAGGDIIEFVRLSYGWSFTEAVEELAREAGVDLPKASPEAVAKEAKRLSIIETLEEAREWFRAQLTKSGEAKAYVKARGITQEQVDRYSIGYAPAGDDDGGMSPLKLALAGRAGVEGLALAGLLIHGDGVPVSYDRFRSRVVVPIRDIRGRTTSFTGRLLGHRDAPKWINGPETEVFHKGATIFNADRARQPAHDGAPVVVTEGPFDVMACERAGYTAAVACMGTAITADHLKGLWRLSDTPTMLMDGDAAGQKAMGKAMATVFPLLVPGRSLRFAQMPPGCDPDDLVRQRGPEALKAVLDASEGLADAFWRVSVSQNPGTSPDDLGRLEAAMMDAFKAIPDDQLRRKYRDDAKGRIRARGAPKPIIRSNGHSNHSTNIGALRLIHGMPQRSQFSLKEACLLAALVSQPGLAADHFEDIPTSGLSDRARQVLDEILHLVTELPDLDATQLLSELQAKGAPITEAYTVVHDAGIVLLDPGGSREFAEKVLKP
jgi:DNA primase